MNFQPIVTGRDHNGLRPGRVEAIGFLLLAVHQHGFDHDQRRLQIGFKLRRIHRRQAFGGGKPQPAVARAARGRLRAAGTFARRQAVGLCRKSGRKKNSPFPGGIVQEFFRNSHQPQIGTNP